MRRTSTLHNKRSRLGLLAVITAAVLAITGLGIVPTASPALALTGAEFDPGYIISDSVFFDGQSMNGDQVQAFLESKAPACTINNGEPSHAAGAAYGSTSIATDCPKTYRQQTPNMAAQAGYCSAYTGGASERFADIVAKVGAACNVSPKVLLVLLQKEQSLITDSWPTVRQYAAATGYDCYDNGQPCVQTYSGFFYQVWAAARQFQRYGGPGLNWIPVGQPTTRPYQDPNVNPNCGSKSLTIRNRATAALYYYTPYTPNDAALNNLYGTGDSCSAYGNRNFWRMFRDWFGSTGAGFNEVALVKALYADVHNREPDTGGLNTWVNALRNQGQPVSYAVNGVLASDEYYKARIVQTYRDVLNRDPEPAGLGYWLNQIQTSRLKVDDLAMIHTASDEFFNVRAGGNANRFVDLLYQSLLGRTAGVSEQQYWAGRMGEIGRLGVIFAIYGSNESAARRINTLYLRYFQRPADRAGIETYTPMILGDMRDQGLRGILVNSPEYYQNAINRFPS